MPKSIYERNSAKVNKHGDDQGKRSRLRLLFRMT